MTTYTLHFEADADTYDLADRLFTLIETIRTLADEPMQLHADTCDRAQHCVYKAEEE
jgi:hypothetical protein